MWCTIRSRSLHQLCVVTFLKGCGRLFAIDGNWKLRYPICMFQFPQQVLAFKKNLSYVNTCSNSPLHGMAFCTNHCEMMKQNGVPTELKEYLKYKKEVSSKIPSTTASSSNSFSAGDCQGMLHIQNFWLRSYKHSLTITFYCRDTICSFTVSWSGSEDGCYRWGWCNKAKL